MEQNAEQQMQIKSTDEMLRGVYANMAQVAHNAEEFIIDFMNLFPPAGTLNARVIVSPAHFKRIVAAMQDNLNRFETEHGNIKSSEVLKNSPTTSSTSNNAYGFDTNKAS